LDQVLTAFVMSPEQVEAMLYPCLAGDKREAVGLLVLNPIPD